MARRTGTRAKGSLPPAQRRSRAQTGQSGPSGEKETKRRRRRRRNRHDGPHEAGAEARPAGTGDDASAEPAQPPDENAAPKLREHKKKEKKARTAARALRP